MNKSKFRRLIEKRILILDGAMGTMLQNYNITYRCPEELNLKSPDIIREVHKSYVNAGADIILTNTFGANRLKLSQFNLEHLTQELNKKAVELAKSFNVIVAGDIGPLGQYIEPLSTLNFDQAYEIYKEQVRALSGVDLLIIETIADIKVFKAAVMAAKENSNCPVIALMTFENFRTSTGTDLKVMATVAEALDCDAIGVNCSSGPKEFIKLLDILIKETYLPIVMEPNAGIRDIIDPKEFASYCKQMALIGANIIGGCCGTTPQHISELVKQIRGLEPVKRLTRSKTRFCSRTKCIEIKDKTIIVGERINPSGKDKLKRDIISGRFELIRKEAISQVKEGALMLDINIGIPGKDEKENMKKALRIVQNVVDVPLLIDSSNPEAIEEGLKEIAGKPIINSVDGNEDSLRLLELAKRYGAGIIVLTIEKGIPKAVDERVKIAKKVINKALAMGIKKEDIFVDCVTLSIALDPNNEFVTLESMKKVKEIGFKTILGISNISYGLPNRSIINSIFLTKASKLGLDLAIANPLDNIEEANTEIKSFVKVERRFVDRKLPLKRQLHEAILYGDEDNIERIIEACLKNTEPIEVNDIMINAMSLVGKKFKNKEYFLPQVILSARTMKKGFNILKKKFKGGGGNKGCVIMATVKNDVHDIGKNIIIALLESHNFKVIDLGKDIDAHKIVDEAEKHNADIIGLSALMTTTAPYIKEVLRELKKRGLKIPVVAGGAVITPEYAEELGVNYGYSGIDSIKVFEKLIKRFKK